jgi:hypothetical protein
MKAGIAIVSFATACLASCLATVWYLAVLVARTPLWPFPSTMIGIEALFAVWGLTMFATFYSSSRPIWDPLLRVSSERVRAARLLLAITLMNGMLWFLVCLILWAVRAHGPLPWAFCLLASAATLLNAVYIVVHWALRPENLFSERFLSFADNPLVSLIFDVVLRRRKIR